MRGGRLTTGQRNAMERLFPAFGLSIEACYPQRLDPMILFGRKAPTIVEIGFGDGESLLQSAKNNPQENYLGIEVHPPGVGHLLLALEKHAIKNVRVFNEDAHDVLEFAIQKNSIDRICLFFPDPWPKKKHQKRRIVQPSFVALCAEKLAPGGQLHFATDWEDYAMQALAVIETCPQLCNLAGRGQFSERPANRPLTKFEQRGQRLGHGVWDAIFSKVSR